MSVSSVAPKRVFFSRNIPYAIDRFKALLGPYEEVQISAFPDAAQCIPRAELLASVRDCHGLFCLLTDAIDTELLDAAGPTLRVVSTMSVGFNHVDTAACRARGVAVGHTPGVLDVSTAETAVALTFAAKRKVVECVDSARTGGWGVWQPFQYCGSDVSGSTVGIVGLGRIGLTYAKMMKFGFGCKIVYTGPSPKPENAAALGDDVQYLALDELLATSDIVSVHAPLTDATRGLFSTDAFAKMKASAVLVNTSRGDVVDQEALVDALQSGEIAAAGLDVTTPEPLPPTHPLFSLGNCVILPHVGSATVRTRQAMADIAVENLIAGLRGEALPHGVV